MYLILFKYSKNFESQCIVDIMQELVVVKSGEKTC